MNEWYHKASHRTTVAVDIEDLHELFNQHNYWWSSSDDYGGYVRNVVDILEKKYGKQVDSLRQGPNK